MSRAFVKESDGGAQEPLPPRRISEFPNHVTPTGMEQLKAELGRLTGRRPELLAQGDDEAAQEALRHVDRDLAYIEARISSALLVDLSAQPRDEVAFGATITVRQATGSAGAPAASRMYSIVGEDEADADAGKVSYVSPLARALLGTQVGQTVTWKRPIGDLLLTVERIEYL
jgi:transcription elongation GreA/GreB family factor